jgi:ribosomal protein S6--L-glutamate ligase
VFTALNTEALLCARNKLRTYQLLCNSGVGMPKTVFANINQNVGQIIAAAGGAPLVIKLLKGTHGLGVILAKDQNTAESVIEGFISLRERVLVQEFIEESSGADLRALVVNGEVVAAMKRRALPGEFRSNLHRGATAIRVKLTQAEEDTALKATQLLGLKVAGVDMLQSKRGPLILEVNPSPGLEGIETYTNIDISGKIIRFIEKEMS